jgi:hypothetical protein
LHIYKPAFQIAHMFLVSQNYGVSLGVGFGRSFQVLLGKLQ